MFFDLAIWNLVGWKLKNSFHENKCSLLFYEFIFNAIVQKRKDFVIGLNSNPRISPKNFHCWFRLKTMKFSIMVKDFRLFSMLVHCVCQWHDTEYSYVKIFGLSIHCTMFGFLTRREVQLKEARRFFIICNGNERLVEGALINSRQAPKQQPQWTVPCSRAPYNNTVSMIYVDMAGFAWRPPDKLD